MALLTDELKTWIGREVHYPAREELSRASIRYFALAVGDDNPLYFDNDYARQAGHDGGRFFAGFRAAGRESDDGQPDPLNRYTERVMTGGHDTPEQRITYAFRLVTARSPSTDELEILIHRLERLVQWERGMQRHDGRGEERDGDLRGLAARRSAAPGEHLDARPGPHGRRRDDRRLRDRRLFGCRVGGRPGEVPGPTV